GTDARSRPRLHGHAIHRHPREPGPGGVQEPPVAGPCGGYRTHRRRVRCTGELPAPKLAESRFRRSPPDGQGRTELWREAEAGQRRSQGLEDRVVRRPGCRRHLRPAEYPGVDCAPGRRIPGGPQTCHDTRKPVNEPIARKKPEPACSVLAITLILPLPQRDKDVTWNPIVTESSSTAHCCPA